MSNLDRERAIFILNRYWKRSFYRADSMADFVAAVRRRLLDANIKGVPKDPVKFINYCQKLGLFLDIKKEKK